jgi:hypothetical protein
MQTSDLELALPRFQSIPAMFHARYGTHGTKTLDQVHPYRVVGDIYMAHNGIFDIPTPDKTKSDTWHMARRLGCHGASRLENLIQSEPWRQVFGEHIGGNKVSFISPSFGIITINEHLGHDVNGVWMSNDTYKPRVWDRGGSTYSGSGFYSSFGKDIEVEDMLSSWLCAGATTRSLLAADLVTNRERAIDTVMHLIELYEDLGGMYGIQME